MIALIKKKKKNGDKQIREKKTEKMNEVKIYFFEKVN